MNIRYAHPSFWLVDVYGFMHDESSKMVECTGSGDPRREGN